MKFGTGLAHPCPDVSISRKSAVGLAEQWPMYVVGGGLGFDDNAVNHANQDRPKTEQDDTHLFVVCRCLGQQPARILRWAAPRPAPEGRRFIHNPRARGMFPRALSGARLADERQPGGSEGRKGGQASGLGNRDRVKANLILCILGRRMPPPETCGECGSNVEIFIRQLHLPANNNKIIPNKTAKQNAKMQRCKKKKHERSPCHPFPTPHFSQGPAWASPSPRRAASVQ